MDDVFNYKGKALLIILQPLVTHLCCCCRRLLRTQAWELWRPWASGDACHHTHTISLPGDNRLLCHVFIIVFIVRTDNWRRERNYLGQLIDMGYICNVLYRIRRFVSKGNRAFYKWFVCLNNNSDPELVWGEYAVPEICDGRMYMNSLGHTYVVLSGWDHTTFKRSLSPAFGYI